MAYTSAAVVGVHVAYDRKGSYVTADMIKGKKIQCLLLGGTQTVAGTPTKQGASINTTNNNLPKNSKWAIVEVIGLGGSAEHAGSIRFTHADFDGCRMGGVLHNILKGTQTRQGQMGLDFRARDYLPVFSSGTSLDMYYMSSATITVTYWLLKIAQVDSCLVGSEDLNYGYKYDFDDSQTLALVTPIVGDSFSIANSRGNAVLKGIEAFGVYADKGYLSTSEQITQPNVIYFPSSEYGCKRFSLENMPIPLDSDLLIYFSTYRTPS